MNSIEGSWDLTLRTPIGSLDVVYTFARVGGALTGTATGRGETVALTDIVQEDAEEGQRVRWRQTVTRPIRLNLYFEVIVTAATLAGYSQAGRLPRSSVIGTRQHPE